MATLCLRRGGATSSSSSGSPNWCESRPRSASRPSAICATFYGGPFFRASRSPFLSASPICMREERCGWWVSERRAEVGWCGGWQKRQEKENNFSCFFTFLIMVKQLLIQNKTHKILQPRTLPKKTSGTLQDVMSGVTRGPGGKWRRTICWGVQLVSGGAVSSVLLVPMKSADNKRKRRENEFCMLLFLVVFRCGWEGFFIGSGEKN